MINVFFFACYHTIEILGTHDLLLDMFAYGRLCAQHVRVEANTVKASIE
jgi:hypothetical protein